MTLPQTPIFQHVTEYDCQRMVECFEAKSVNYKADTIIDMEAWMLQSIAIVMKGEVELSRYDINGRKSILDLVRDNEIFVELTAFGGSYDDGVLVKCLKDSEIMFIANDQITKRCSKACECHSIVVDNMLRLISSKAASLSGRVEVLTQRSIRDKLLAYFSRLAYSTGRTDFLIPFSMTTLADYLCTDRSAMSRELKNLREEGLIEIDGRHVTLHL